MPKKLFHGKKCFALKILPSCLFSKPCWNRQIFEDSNFSRKNIYLIFPKKCEKLFCQTLRNKGSDSKTPSAYSIISRLFRTVISPFTKSNTALETRELLGNDMVKGRHTSATWYKYNHPKTVWSFNSFIFIF